VGTAKPASVRTAGFQISVWIKTLISFLGSGILGGSICAGGLMDAGGTLVFLADFFHEAAGDEILEFFVCTEAKHFLATADSITDFQIGENAFEEVVKAEDFGLGENIAQFVSNMVG